MTPRVSVVMPVYNGEKYLRKAIDSLLCQTFVDFELIIINDASQDGSEEIIQSYDDRRIVYLKNSENLGVARTLNRGIAAARAEYIARLDSDDISLPTRLEKQVQFMDATPQVGLCGTWAQALEIGAGNITQTTTIFEFICQPEKIKISLLFGNNFLHSSVMFRKACLQTIPGGYNPEFSFAEDYDLWVRISRNWKVVNIPEILILYRIHDLQISTQKAKKQQEQAWLIQKKQIEAMNIHPNQDEELIHKYLAGLICFDISLAQVIIGGRYFLKLEKANEKYKIYDHAAFHQIIWNKWNILEEAHIHSVKVACLSLWLAIKFHQFDISLLTRLAKNLVNKLYKKAFL